MSRWFHENEDPFSKVGHIRLIVVRHNPTQYNWKGQLENCTHIAYVGSFQLGFMSPVKTSRTNSVAMGWLEDEVHESCAHQINHMMKPFPNGIYEVIGDLYHWSSQSYEGEWDGDSELRDTQMREITFNTAMYFGGTDSFEDGLIRLLDNNSRQRESFSDNYDIHHYMEKKQILVNCANALTFLIEGSYGHRTNYNESKIPDLENLMHMLMLQIDSSKSEEVREQALEIDQKTQNCLRDHEKLMVPDEYTDS